MNKKNMRTNYTVEVVPYEMDKDRSRAYVTPNCLRESHLKPGQHVKITAGTRETVLKIIPKFDGDDHAVYLPREEIMLLGVRAGDLVTVEKSTLDYPACTHVVVLFKKMRKTVERLEALRLILEDKKVVQNGDVILGGQIKIKEERARISEETKIKIETEDKALPATGLEKEIEGLKQFIDNAHCSQGRGADEESTQEKRVSVYMQAPKGMVISGEAGMGKKTLCLFVLQEIGKEWVRVHGHSPKAIEDAFEYAKINEPCTVWIDRLDRYVEEKQIETVSLVERMLEEITKERRRIAVIATVNSLSHVPRELRSAHVLDKSIILHAPTSAQRKAQIEMGVQEHSAQTGCAVKEDVLDAAAKRTAGFTRGDLFLLLRDSLFSKGPSEKEVCTESLQKAIPLDESMRNLAISKGTGVCDGECMHRLMTQIVRTIPSASDGAPAEVPDIRFSSIFGQEVAKEKLMETIIWPITHRSLFSEVGVSPPKGVLLYGPPGCGKTLIAQALANESGSVFLSIRGPEIMGKYVGESEERVRRVFASARAQVPSIIFIDEIDSIAPHRGAEGGQVDKRVVSTLLTEMDGVGGAAGVFVLGATNKPWSIDSALMRPGRFDCHVLVDLPSRDTRKEIIQNKLGKTLAAITRWGVQEKNTGLLAEFLADTTEGFTGAELTGLCTEISMGALRLKIQGTGSGDGEVTEQAMLDRLKEIARNTTPRIPLREIETFRQFSRDPMSIPH
ncbi:hypothetical protein NERG_00563 [Nematocida ausubeli]|uniref:AAA+ ATPase domain-containing protein n=1 Tax=Nematocida ausubeli (strain ATCC PRA-371 / ERTm2) TaxID=1913371 RepID=H8ZAE2_NEMA1|nr:hypothetical protein NERG_00563 [Nematocida ausubeli]